MPTINSIFQRLKFSLLGKPRENSEIIVVSGLPRSGTSMMMKMLEKGGVTLLTDGLREADSDNPKGYYEFERVKALDKGDTAWVNGSRGKAVKVISALLRYLPSDNQYKVIFMRREMKEILASQKKMLENRGEQNDSAKDEDLAVLFSKHLQEVVAWMERRPNIELLFVDYGEVLADPGTQVARLCRFLDRDLDVHSMRMAVDRRLYRQRAGKNRRARA